MREIKFRGWEKELKEMIPVNDIDFEKKMINTESAWRSFREVELMQFTGLKDNNGKEIYEGDIVESEKGKHQVNYYLSQFELNRLPKVFLRNDNNLLLSEWFDQCEVIGNIYENPELLEGNTP